MVRLLLYPFSLLYGIGIYFRNRFYDLNILKSREFKVPVISIGNITVGGTGKTPHVEYLIRLLKDKFEVAALSRGYKRKTSGFRFVECDMPVREAGDEPVQIRKKFPDVTVAVCENRVHGVEKLLHTDTKRSPDVVILDDAFQHRRIKAGINILLIDYNRPLNKDMLLPAGRLREGAVQIRRANIIIFTKCPAVEITPIMRRILQKDIKLKPYQNLFFTTLNYGRIKAVYSNIEAKNDFYTDHSYGILIVAGIASPHLIPHYLKQFAGRADMISFPDHYNYSKKDIDTIMSRFDKINKEKKIIITTEKDAVRFADIPDPGRDFKEALYYLPVEIEFLDGEECLFNKKILNYVEENKSNRELFERKIQG
jgi:tetraacyldisaccharide 4'-kinase